MSTISFEDVEPGFYRDQVTWTEMPLPSKEDALRFLGAMGELDYDAGDWNEMLVLFALKCDVPNRRKLRREFGGLVSAAILYKEHNDGFSLLWKLADRWDERPNYMYCGRGENMQKEETCSRGLSCANLGLSPWTSAGCPDA